MVCFCCFAGAARLDGVILFTDILCPKMSRWNSINCPPFVPVPAHTVYKTTKEINIPYSHIIPLV